MARAYIALTSMVLALSLGCTRLADEGSPVSAASAATHAPSDSTGPTPLPSWFNFVSAHQAQTWVQKRDSSSIRQHGWTLFAALNQPAVYPSFNLVLPIWQTWPTTSQLFPYAGGTRCPDGTPVCPCPEELGGEPGTEAAVGLNARNFANAEALEGLGDDADQINLPGPSYTLPEEVARLYPDCVLNGQLIDGTRFQSNGDVMIANVVYNPTAADRIRQWTSASFLDGLLPSKTSPPKILTMPTNSIVLKPMQWPVQGGEGKYTALPVWPDLTSKQMWHYRGQYAGFEIQKTDPDFPLWADAVAVTAGTVGTTPQTVTFPTQGYVEFKGQELSNTYRSAKVVSVGDFYHREYTWGELNWMAPCDRALLDASAIWAYGRRFQRGDYLITVAMHIMTKEQPDWTFQSVWWSPEATYPANHFAKLRPDRIPASGPEARGPWDHYVMTSTWGMKQQDNGPSGHGYPPDQGNGLWPVAMNPYIELAAHHPIATNCMNCHHRAAWPNSRVRNNPAHPHDRQASYLATAHPGPIEPYPLNDSELFAGLVTLDSMWAVSDRACYSPTGDEEEAPPAR